MAIDYPSSTRQLVKGPDRSVRLDALRAGRALSRRYRNRRIGEFFKELELTEGRGTGIPKIKRVMAENLSPNPVFEFDEEHTYFAVVLPAHPASLAALKETTEQVTGQVTGQVAEQVLPMLVKLQSGESSRTELQEQLGLSHRDYFVDRYLKPALDAELIEMTIPEKPRSSAQKYRLTSKGRAILEGDLNN